MDAAALPCARCGYDLRAQPADGVCPECGETVAESRRVSAVPTRPAWADSDPRWRRRMVAGAWVLTLIPLLSVLQTLGWTDRQLVPVFWEPQFNWETLDNAFVSMVYPYLAFCVGAVLLFSKERFRRRNRLDWTRRWGVLLSYLVLLLIVPSFSLVMCLVMIGIAALFHSLPIENQPYFTGALADFGAGYVYYGPQLYELGGYFVLAAMSACLVLLACVPIYNALRSSGPRWVACVLPAPLAAIALWHVVTALSYFVYPPLAAPPGLGDPYSFFFGPFYLTSYLSELLFGYKAGFVTAWNFAEEAVKWLSCLFIAVWLTVAQVRAWRRRARQVQLS